MPQKHVLFRAQSPQPALSGFMWLFALLKPFIDLIKAKLFVTRPKTSKRKLSSSLAPPSRLHFKASGVSSVATARLVAKRWKEKIARNEASMHASSALWDLFMEPARQRVIEELTYQSCCFSPVPPEALEELDSDVRERMLGDRLYRLVKIVEPNRVGKVTGMILELDNDELLSILSPSDPVVGAEALIQWVAEAQGVLREVWLAEAPKAPPSSPVTRDDGWTTVQKRRRGRGRRGLSIDEMPISEQSPVRPEPARPRFSHDELELKLAVTLADR